MKYIPLPKKTNDWHARAVLICILWHYLMMPTDTLHGNEIKPSDLNNLHDVAQLSKTNRDSIWSWQGVAEVEIKRVNSEGRVLAHIERRIEYFSNYLTDRSRTLSTMTKHLRRNDDKLEKCPLTYEVVALDGTKAYYRYTRLIPDREIPESMNFQPVLMIRPAPYGDEKSLSPKHFDPREVAFHRRETPAVLMNYYHSLQQEGDFSHISINYSNGIMTFRSGWEEVDMYTKRVIDRNSGCCLEYHNLGGTHHLDIHKKFEWRKSDDIWHPIKVVETNLEKTGKTITTIKVNFVESQINEEEPEGLFELSNFDLRRGDRVDNRITGKMYKITSEDYLPRIAEESRKMSLLRKVAISTGVLLLVIALVYVIRRRRLNRYTAIDRGGNPHEE